LKENEKQIIETKDHEEKPILRKEYYWDDEVIENGNANLKWKLLINTNIALNNYYINGILINANQQLNEYNERQSKIIKDLGDTIQQLKEKNNEYKKLFDDWWKMNEYHPMEIDEINQNQDAIRIDEALRMNEIINFDE